MGRLLAFLFENPLVLFALVAWVFASLGSAAKKASRARPPARPGSPTPTPSLPRNNPDQRAEEIAAEMRRLLGMEPPAATPPPAVRPPAARPAAVQRPQREVVRAERPTQPVRPTAGQRRLRQRPESHVGEDIQHRHMESAVNLQAGAGMGELGGRSSGVPGPRGQTGPRLVALSDLKRAFVMAEILGKPRALRPAPERAGEHF